MAIDLNHEHLLTLAEAAALLPGRPSVCTLWRWRTKGIAGRKLESVALGGKILTSREAIQRFARQQGGVETPTVRSPKRRAKDHARAEKELEQAGI